jgi:sec-independent protein translocase protein TatC
MKLPFRTYRDRDSEDGSDGSQMSFIDHLEELRWRIIYSLLGVAAGTIVCWVFIDPIVEQVLLRPAVQFNLKIINLRPFGQVFLYMQVAFIAGIIVSIPNIFYHIWKFVAPGLYRNERKYIGGIVIFTTLCFAAGATFAYYVIMPAAFNFFVTFGTSRIENSISIEEYLNFTLNLMLGAGLVFELPMVSFFLSRLGILTPQFMRKYWRHAVVIIFIFAAFLSPGTDPVSMILLAVPLMGLYEISIWIARVSQKRREKALE